MASNPLVPLDFEGLYATIGPIFFTDSVDVVPIGVVEVDLLFVDKILEFVVVGVVPNLLPFRWNPCCHIG